MSDVYVIGGESYTIHGGSMVTRVTLTGRRRRRAQQLSIVLHLWWSFDCVKQMSNGGGDFLVYIRPDLPPDINRGINNLMWDLKALRAILTPVTPMSDVILGPYPHQEERLEAAVRAGDIFPDAYAVRLFFDSEIYGQRVLTHQVKHTLPEALQSLSHIEQPCRSCLRRYQTRVPSGAEFTMADVVPLIAMPF